MQQGQRKMLTRNKNGILIALQNLLSDWWPIFQSILNLALVSCPQKREPTLWRSSIGVMCDRDILYEGLGIDMVLAYMADLNKQYPKDQVKWSTHSCICKRSTICRTFAARFFKKDVSTSYYSDMKGFLIPLRTKLTGSLQLNMMTAWALWIE